MSNSLLNISMITKESLRQLKNQLAFAKGVNRQYDEKFAKSGAKIGSVINIRKPVRFDVTDGAALNLQGVSDQSEALTLDSQKHVAFQFSSKELTLSIDEFSDRYIKPAVTALANKVDYDGLLMAKNSVWNSVGVPGTQPSSEALALSYALGAGQKLDENGCPVDGQRHLVVSPATQAAYVSKLAGLFNSQPALAKQYEKGKMADALGFAWKMDQNVVNHTVGDHEGTPAIDTTVTANGTATLHLDGSLGTVTGWAKKGDVISIAGVYSVNPQTKESTGSLMQFVVTADTDSDTNEIAELPIAPAIQLTGPYKNVSKAPTDGDIVTIFGHATAHANLVSPANIAYHKDAFVLGCADLDLPGGVDMASRAVDPESGLSIRLVRAYDINNDVMPCRLDILYGWKAVYPELACRIQG